MKRKPIGTKTEWNRLDPKLVGIEINWHLNRIETKTIETETDRNRKRIQFETENVEYRNQLKTWFHLVSHILGFVWCLNILKLVKLSLYNVLQLFECYSESDWSGIKSKRIWKGIVELEWMPGISEVLTGSEFFEYTDWTASKTCLLRLVARGRTTLMTVQHLQPHLRRQKQRRNRCYCRCCPHAACMQQHACCMLLPCNMHAPCCLLLPCSGMHAACCCRCSHNIQK